MTKRRVLFVSECLTLAQVVRLLALGRRLDPARYELHFASAEFEPAWFDGTPFRRWPLHTIDKATAFRALARGDRLYDKKTLRRYVEDELRLFDEVKPDLIVGDFRLSLAISAPLRRLACAILINAYWSPFAVRKGFPVPDHPIVTLVGHELAARYFPQAMPKVFAHFAAPVNAVRKKYGLSEIGSLLEVLTFGDYTLYPDVPELCPVDGAPPAHRYLGAVPWSPDVRLPAWWAELSEREPVIYVTLGSSGAIDALPVVLEALENLPVQVVVSTAGRTHLKKLPSNARAAEFLPGSLVARRSAFVVTNGGSSTGYQALGAGVPVLGIPSNLDQYLAMTAIEQHGAGVLVRAGGVTADKVRSAALELLGSQNHRTAATNLARAFASRDCHVEFEKLLTDQFGDA